MHLVPPLHKLPLRLKGEGRSITRREKQVLQKLVEEGKVKCLIKPRFLGLFLYMGVKTRRTSWSLNYDERREESGWLVKSHFLFPEPSEIFLKTSRNLGQIEREEFDNTVLEKGFSKTLPILRLLTRSEALVLKTLVASPAASLSEISSSTGISVQYVKKLLSTLKNRGLGEAFFCFLERPFEEGKLVQVFSLLAEPHRDFIKRIFPLSSSFSKIADFNIWGNTHSAGFLILSSESFRRLSPRREIVSKLPIALNYTLDSSMLEKEAEKLLSH